MYEITRMKEKQLIKIFQNGGDLEQIDQLDLSVPPSAMTNMESFRYLKDAGISPTVSRDQKEDT